MIENTSLPQTNIIKNTAPSAQPRISLVETMQQKPDSFTPSQKKEPAKTDKNASNSKKLRNTNYVLLGATALLIGLGFVGGGVSMKKVAELKNLLKKKTNAFDAAIDYLKEESTQISAEAKIRLINYYKNLSKELKFQDIENWQIKMDKKNTFEEAKSFVDEVSTFFGIKMSKLGINGLDDTSLQKPFEKGVEIATNAAKQISEKQEAIIKLYEKEAALEEVPKRFLSDGNCLVAILDFEKTMRAKLDSISSLNFNAQLELQNENRRMFSEFCNDFVSYIKQLNDVVEKAKQKAKILDPKNDALHDLIGKFSLN